MAGRKSGGKQIPGGTGKVPKKLPMGKQAKSSGGKRSK